MAINYALVPITTNARDKNAAWTIHAAAQSTETVTTRDIAEHLASHHSPFSVGTIIGLLEDAQRCIMEHLRAGARVDLDTLGAFYTTVTSRGTTCSEDFTDDCITRINLRWKPSRQMKKNIQNTPLRLVPNRAEQRKAKKKMAEIANAEVNSQLG
ncbi:MAG: hypothetical protein IJK45_10270 [Bacteroidaceae bacterium]|nr:hypothetical protein [Bacteroidaceae bacterium]